MESLVPFKQGVKDLAPGDSHGFKPGQMDTPDGTATYAVEAVFAFTVNASSAQAALTTTQREQVLSDFEVDFRTHIVGAPPLEPYQGLNLLELREEARRKLEVEPVGIDDTATGLAKAFALGSNSLGMTLRIPLCHLEFINESADLHGISRAMMAASEFECKLARDPFATINGALSLTKCTVTYAPVWRSSPLDRFALVPEVRRLQSESDTIKSGDGLVITLEQKGALATTTLARIRAEVGGIPVVREPKTPKDVQAAYERKPDTGTTEKLIQSRRTPIMLVADTGLSAMLPGFIEAKQVDDNADWDAYVSLIPALSYAQVRGIVAKQAESLKQGQQLLAVNAASVAGLKLPDALLPFAGFVFLPSTDAAFSSYAGLRADRDGNVVVSVPPDKARTVAARVAWALMPSAEYPSGDARRAEMLVRDVLAEIPGAATVDGFDTSTFPAQAAREALAPYVAQAVADLQRARAA